MGLYAFPVMRLLITGAAGMLGSDLRRAAVATGCDVTALTRAELDIGDAEAVNTAVAEVRPDAIVNCAAYTNVDGAESDPDGAAAVNASGAGNVAQAASGVGAWVVHVSTDYVFDGAASRPYLESDPTGPRSVYGSTKLLGERAVALRAPEHHTIVRTSWLFGTGGPCFPATMLKLAAERDTLTVVADQVGCPTLTAHLAQVLIGIAAAAAPSAAARPPLGVLHVAGSGQCSWFEFAQEIVARAGAGATVLPCTTEQFPRPARRPAFSVLRSERDAPVLPDWREGLEQYLASRVSA